MRKGKRHDQKLVIRLITRMFKDNPAVLSLIHPEKTPEKGIENLAASVTLKSLHRNGIWISSNEKAAALCFRFNSGKFSLLEYFLDLHFAFKYIGLKRLPGILAREAYRKKQRPADGNYFYFWFFAALPDAGEAAFELKNEIFEEARKFNLPIFTETSVARNQRIYERYGFKTYHIWEDPQEKIRFWFLKWEP